MSRLRFKCGDAIGDFIGDGSGDFNGVGVIDFGDLYVIGTVLVFVRGDLYNVASILFRGDLCFNDADDGDFNNDCCCCLYNFFSKSITGVGVCACVGVETGVNGGVGVGDFSCTKTLSLFIFASLTFSII